MTQKKTEWVGVAVMPYTHTQEVLSLNLESGNWLA
jgi:hypothetical protein